MSRHTTDGDSGIRGTIMRIIHTSDLHLEAPLTRLSPEVTRTRKNELFDSFFRTVDEAARLGVRLFIISGDLFDSERVTKRGKDRVLAAIERHPDIDFLYLPGNHERDGFITRISTPPGNLKIFGAEWTSYDFGEVTVTGRSVCSAGMFDGLCLDPKKKNIVVLHGEITSAGSDDEKISLREAAGHGIDYLALGHYHSYSEHRIDTRGVAVYSGTPEGRGFDEAGECGFMLLETDADGVRRRFCPFAKRRIRIIEADITGAGSRREMLDIVQQSTASASHEDIVRLVITGKHPPELYADTVAISLSLENRFFYLEVRDESRVDISPSSYIHDLTLKGEFIRLVLAREDIPEKMKDKIIKCGIAALLGEDTEI